MSSIDDRLRFKGHHASLLALVVLLHGCAGGATPSASGTGSLWVNCQRLEPRGTWTIQHRQDSRFGTYYTHRWFCRDRVRVSG